MRRRDYFVAPRRSRTVSRRWLPTERASRSCAPAYVRQSLHPERRRHPHEDPGHDDAVSASGAGSSSRRSEIRPATHFWGTSRRAWFRSPLHILVGRAWRKYAQLLSWGSLCRPLSESCSAVSLWFWVSMPSGLSGLRLLPRPRYRSVRASSSKLLEQVGIWLLWLV